MTFWEILLLSFVEGLTEFLPISSTGHLILTSHFLHLQDPTFAKSFNIIIQSGAILAVLVEYWRRFLPIQIRFYEKILVAFLPAAVIGVLVKDRIDAILDSIQIVAWALILGGVVLIIMDRFWKNSATAKPIAEMSFADTLKIGFIQCLAFIPGVSRAGATILGGLWVGLDKKTATEFSFFLAVPTLIGASVLKGYKVLPQLTADHAGALALGFLFSFLFAWVAIRFFIALVTRVGFFYFGVYRIILGTLILLFFAN